jgi:hypothetical protein
MIGFKMELLSHVYSKTSEKLFIIVWMLISYLYMSTINTTSLGESYAFQMYINGLSYKFIFFFKVIGLNLTNFKLLKIYMVVNFKIYKINRDA